MKNTLCPPSFVPRHTKKAVTPPKTTSSCGTIANFNTQDACWQKWNDTNSAGLCDARFGSLRDENTVWESFTGASCECGRSEKGDGFHCYRPCGPTQLRAQKCADPLICQIDVNNTAYCGCPPGQKLFNSIYCINEEDSCKTCKFDCHAASKCISGSGLKEKAFTCGDCDPELGYSGLNGYCNDIDECKRENNCDDKATCINKIPLLDDNMKYECKCNKGYQGQGTKCSPCQDINECLTPGICGPSAHCINTDGSYTCKCNPGYIAGPNGLCVDVNECVTMQYPCRANSKCNNTNGSYECPCDEGYVGDGKLDFTLGCQVDQAICARCDDATTDCLLNEKGTAYECRCKKNHLPIDKVTCKPRTYCNEREKVNCAPIGKADCFDRADGSGYECKCAANFTGDGVVCREIDRCVREKPCTLVPGTQCKTDKVDPYEKFECECLADHVRQVADERNMTAQCYSKFDFGANNCSVCTDREECYSVTDTQFKDTLKSCKCKDGYKHLTDGRCHNINECQTGEHDCDEYRAICNDKDPIKDHAKYECKCKRGYDGTGQKDSCSNVDECVLGDSVTGEAVCQDEGELCVDSSGSYDCICKAGYVRRDNSCEDVNECAMNIHRCPAFSKCLNKIPGYQCECLSGFKPTHFDNKTLSGCVNINECQTSTMNNCDEEREECHDTPGSYVCTCKTGFQKVNQHCEDIDECQKTNDNECSLASTTCNNTLGGYFCACKQGYEPDLSGAPGSNHTCKDIDECNTFTHKCHPNSYCKNHKGSYTCVCDEGFVISPNSPKGTITPYCIREKKCEKDRSLCIPGICVDIEEEPYYRCDCIVGTINYNNTACIDSKYCNAFQKDFECPEHAECKGKGVCQCKQGYRWIDLTVPFTIDDIRTKRVCKPIDFCATFNNCGEMKCRNTGPGNGECYCPDGFQKEENRCIDVNECEKKPCPTNTTCHNSEGSYECHCPQGYIHTDGPMTKPTCDNVDECVHKLDNCTSYTNSHCEDTPGAFVCACNKGYKRDQIGNYAPYRNCIDDDECEKKDDVCEKIAKCTNTLGSYYCSCPAGYRGDGDKGLPCDDIDECDLLTHNCSTPSERCVNEPGTFHCECNKGYEKIGGKCENINECLKKLHNCDPIEKCVDTLGSFYCDCAPGYYRPKPDAECQDLNECTIPASCPSGDGDICNNTIGSYECLCKPGFEKPKACRHNPTTCACENINECLVGRSDGSPYCGKNTNCTDLIGTAECVCKTNYVGDAYSKEGCKLVNICESKPCAKYENTICKAVGEADFECPCKADNYVRVGLNSLNCREILCGGTEDLKDPYCVGGTCREVLNKDSKQYEAKCICKDNEIAVNITGKPLRQKCESKDVCKCGTKPSPCIGSPECSDPTKMTCHPNHEKTVCTCHNYFKYNEVTKKCDETNPCSPNPCPVNATCSALKDGQGFNMTFVCTCPRGQKLERVNGVQKCVRDEANCESCKSIPHSECTPKDDPFAICQCKDDYVPGIDGSCVLDDACKRWTKHNPNQKKCGENARPESDDTNSKCLCVCNKGFKPLNETECIDRDECLELPQPCAGNISHPDCVNTLGSYECTCGKGNADFELSNGVCQPVNKCLKSECDLTSTECEKLTGTCNCLPGQERHNVTYCQNIDECERKTYDCPKYSSCFDKTPGYDCICDSGFVRVELTEADPKPHHAKGFQCKDVDECLKDNVCPEGSECVNEVGSYRCVCKLPQFNVGKYNCAFNSTKDCTCNDNAHCILVVSTAAKTTHNCTCNAGYEGDGVVCTDINECPKACAYNANCTNLPGSFKCDCPPPFQGSGLAGEPCKRVPHCNPNPCPVGSQCSLLEKQVEGKWFTCTCPTGFQYNVKNNTCDNINECELCKDYKHCPCPKDATQCIDTQGSFTCTCASGFQYDPKDNQCDDIVECETDIPAGKCLDNMGKCVNEIGSWNCTCLEGYENKKGDKQQCQEIIICGTERDPCFKNTTDCVSTGPGKYTCECKSGYTRDIMDSRMCADIDENLIGTCGCNIMTETCINTPGSYKCECLSQYERDPASGKCVPLKKCENECPEGASCYVDRDDKPQCKCPFNYQLTPDNKTCTIKSCELQGKDCPRNAQCVHVQIRNDTLTQKGVTAPNQAGNNICVCDHPFIFDWSSGTCTVPKDICKYTKCRDFEVCKTTDNPPFATCTCMAGQVCKNTTVECTPEMCGKNAECVMIMNTPVCKCKPGFVGLGIPTSDCKPVKKCDERTCSVFASCQNDECVCDSHYHGNGTTCYDKNECVEKNADGSAMHNCHVNADCHNTQGGFICKCKTGFSGTGQKCDDVDECALNLHNCHAETTECNNTIGSYYCKCKEGFKQIAGVSNKCEDIDECGEKTHKCDNATSDCFNEIPGYSCECKAGYRNSPANKKICLNVDECAEKLSDCHKNAMCKDLVPADNNGSKYLCICKDGYTGNGVNCEPIDQCAIKNGGCDTATTKCQMLWDVPAATCNCLPGYEKENPRDKICKNKNECLNGEAVFDKETTECIDTPGSYELKCKDGYANKHPQANATNAKCEDLDECAMDAAYAEALKLIEENQKTRKYTNEEMINIIPAPKTNGSGYALCYNYAKAGAGWGSSNPVMLPFCKNEQPLYNFGRTRPLSGLPSAVVRGFSCECGVDAKKPAGDNNWKCEDPACNCEQMLGAHAICRDQKCVCKEPYLLTYDQTLKKSICDLKECSIPLVYPTKLLESGKTNLIICEEGKFRPVGGFKIVRHNETNEIIDIIDINECEENPNACCRDEKSCKHDLCVKCVNTPGSFRCALARNASIDCSIGCVDVNTCKCSSIVCPVQDAWFYNCERQCNASSHPALDDPKYNKKVCSRFVDNLAGQYKTFNTLRDLYIAICKFSDVSNNRYACMFGGNDNDLAKSPMFNYWGECQPGANADKVTCPNGEKAKTVNQLDDFGNNVIVSRAVCKPVVEDWPLMRKIVNGEQTKNEKIVVGFPKGISTYPASGEPWCFGPMNNGAWEAGNFYALPSGFMSDFY